MRPAVKPISSRGSFWGKWFLLALVMGCLAGLAGIVFESLTQSIQHFTLGEFAGFQTRPTAGEHLIFGPSAAQPNVWLILPLMGLGGLATGLIVYFLAPDAAGAGVDRAIDAFHNQRGMIPLRVPIVKTLASAITLGTGGSAGREGPIAQIGAGIGSYLGQLLRLSTHDRRILLAIGMGAGVGAIFRAPLAGAIFAGEILYRDADIESEVIIPGALASTIAYSVFQFLLPNQLRFTPLFGDLFQYEVTHVVELIPYSVLALVLVLFSAAYVTTYLLANKLFERLPVVPHLKPAIGALAAGGLAIGAYFLAAKDPHVLALLGSGYGLLQEMLDDATSIGVAVLFVVAAIKILTTSLTVGSGGSGGVFGPSMVIGGSVGAGIGKLYAQFMPDAGAQPGAFAIVGMAGFFAGCANAPFSTILMVTEITGSYQLLLPTLWVSSICFILCRNWSLYSNQVNSRLDSPAHRGDFTIDLLAGIRVRDIYRTTERGIVFHEEDSLDLIVHALAKSSQRYFHVYNAAEEPVGIFSSEDVRPYLYDDVLWKIANARDVMVEDVVSLELDDDLNYALGQFTALNVDELPVVASSTPQKIIGVLRRKEAIAIYNERRLKLQKQKEDENKFSSNE